MLEVFVLGLSVFSGSAFLASCLATWQFGPLGYSAFWIQGISVLYDVINIGRHVRAGEQVCLSFGKDLCIAEPMFLRGVLTMCKGCVCVSRERMLLAGRGRDMCSGVCVRVPLCGHTYYFDTMCKLLGACP